MAPPNNSRPASERDTPRVQPARAHYQRVIASLDVRRLHCIDASGVHRAMTRRDGRAPTGARVVGTVPQHSGPHGTMGGAWGAQGRPAVLTGQGAMDTAVLRASVKPGLGPTRSPGDIVVLDT